MKIFNNHIEATIYLNSEFSKIFALEECHMPFKKYRRFAKNMSKLEQPHFFLPVALGCSGIWSVTYIEEKKIALSKGFPTIQFMPYKLTNEPDNIYALKMAGHGDHDESITSLYAPSFFEKYRYQKNLSSSIDIIKLMGTYFGRSHHIMMVYRNGYRFGFSREGVELGYGCNGEIVMANDFDASFCIDMDGSMTKETIIKHINDYLGNNYGI